MSDDLLTAAELAHRLKVKPGTIREWTRIGKIPARRLSHKVIRYCLAEVVASLESASPKGGGR